MKIKNLLFSLCVIIGNALTSKAQISQRWYSYSDYQYYNETAAGSTVDFAYLQLWNDTTGLYGYNDPTTGLPTYTVNEYTSDGLSFAPVLNNWNTVGTYGSTIKVGPGDAYTIDSVRIYGGYSRNNAKPLVKDTLRLAFVYGNGANTTNLPQYQFTGSTAALYGVDTLKYLQMMYDSIKKIAGKNPGVTTAPYVQSIVLGVPDTSSSFARTFGLTTPYAVPAGNSAAMSLTFKSGDAAYTPFDTIQYASGAFKYGDFFSLIQFAGTLGSPAFPTYDSADKNVGYFADPVAAAAGAGWAGLYIPTWAYAYGGFAPTAFQYPVIEYHINCPTCDLNDTITGITSVCAGSNTTLAFSTTGGTWSSSSTTIATVGSSTGVVNGVSAGVVTITYNLSGHHAYTSYTVNAIPAALAGTFHVCPDASTTLSTTPAGGTWSSSSTSVADVDFTGAVHGHEPGTTIITYTSLAGCSRAAIVTVNPAPAPIGGATEVCAGSTTTLTDATTPGTWSSSTTVVATVNSAGVVTGVSAGSGFITYTAAGCSAELFVNVVVAPTTAGTITGASGVCVGSSTMLSDFTGSGSWSSGNTAIATVDGSGDVFGIAGGSATISYTVSNVCGSLSATSVINVNPLPDAGVVTGLSTICQGDSATLTDAATGGGWNSSNMSVATVTSTGTVYGASAGIATISYSVTNSCGTQAAVLAVNVLSAIECIMGVVNTANIQAPEVTIYPNPNQGTFILNVSSPNNDDAHVVITNIVGAKVKEFTTATNKTTDVKLDQPAGIYIIAATTGSGKYVARIVVE